MLKLKNIFQNFQLRQITLLQEIEKFTLQHHAHANMLSGPVQGKLLEMISKMIQPDKILEIGTFMGYSALCLAKGLTAERRIAYHRNKERRCRHFEKLF